MKKNEMGGTCGTYGGEERCIQGWVGKPEVERPLGRPGCSWEDNIKIDLKEIGWQCVDWIDLAQDRDKWRALMNAVMHLRVP
jgi:hypothetical protein